MSSSPLIPEKMWQQASPAMQTAIRLLMQHYEQQLATLQQRLAELEQRLDQNSTNSSRPPSSDGPTVKRRPPESPSGRARGGQPGHGKQQRPLLPPDQIISCKPSACNRCGHALHGDDPEPHHHQVLELPPIRPEVTGYQLHRLQCLHCGHLTSGRLPDGVPSSCQGPRLQSTVGLLTGNYRLSKRKAAELCHDLQFDGNGKSGKFGGALDGPKSSIWPCATIRCWLSPRTCQYRLDHVECRRT
jgi:transposase